MLWYGRGFARFAFDTNRTTCRGVLTQNVNAPSSSTWRLDGHLRADGNTFALFLDLHFLFPSPSIGLVLVKLS